MGGAAGICTAGLWMRRGTARVGKGGDEAWIRLVRCSREVPYPASRSWAREILAALEVCIGTLPRPSGSSGGHKGVETVYTVYVGNRRGDAGGKGAGVSLPVVFFFFFYFFYFYCCFQCIHRSTPCVVQGPLTSSSAVQGWLVRLRVDVIPESTLQ